MSNFRPQQKAMRFIFTLLTLSFTFMSLAQDGLPVQVTVKNGIIEGYQDMNLGLKLFLGVPFAKPPVGPLRWKAPQPLEDWKGVKQTKKFGPRPVQTNIFGDMMFRSDGISEDCLYLNVWSPSTYNKKNLPVLVYFYGGGYVAGDGSEPRYDGASMAKKGIVVVTVNYRLNIFGFLSHPELSKETDYKGSGNYGLMDQIAALGWVQENIAKFGGDPRKVTIAGESAGSISVSFLMASPKSRFSMNGAIGESGAGMNMGLAAQPLAQAEEAGAAFQKKFGFKNLAAMRDMSASELFERYQDYNPWAFGVSIDGYVFPKNIKSIAEIYEKGQQAQVPLLVGWNTAESGAGGLMMGKPLTSENYVAQLKALYPNDWQEVEKLYPSDAASLEWSATDLASDRFISYSTWKWFDLQRNTTNKPVYRYLYAKLRPPLKDASMVNGLAGGVSKRSGPPPPQPIGAPHACEIEYAMGNLPLINVFAWTDDDYTVSNTMQNYFANFIISGDPNGKDLLKWPAAVPKDPNPDVMVIDVKSAAVKAQKDARYQFHDKQYKK
jgi:para-nitrobenzyl esterase